MPQTVKSESVKREFITLEVSQVGFVVYGIGPGANKCSFHGQPLPQFLDSLWRKMAVLKVELNQSWDKLDKQNRHNPQNMFIIEKFIGVGFAAYSLAVDLASFAPHCMYGPTDPLRHIFIQRLEEIFTKCFSAAHMFGDLEESVAGLRGLLTDFEVNGGIDHKTGNAGSGLNVSVYLYYVAHFWQEAREPICYQRFGELIEAITLMINTRYPKAAEAFAASIVGLLESSAHGFANKFTSEPKAALLEKLSSLVDQLLKPQVAEKRIAVTCIN